MTKNFDVEKLDAYLNDMFNKKGFTGLSITLLGPEGVIYQRGFGKRSVENDLPVDENTVFGIASMSKSFTTLALAILQTEGKVNFDDPVSKYFPNFSVPGLPQSSVTLRHLAMHTAGIPPIQPLEWSIAVNSTERDTEWSRNMRKTSPNKMDKIEDIINYIAAGDYGYPGYTTLGGAGEYMSYSNEGYAILSYVVDQVSGTTLEEFLKERVFKPLEMNRTLLDVDGSEARELAKATDVTGSPDGNVSSLFDKDADGKLVWDDHYSILPPFRGCACIKSTSSDMSHYYKALADFGMWNGKQVIPAEAVELMIGGGFPLSPSKYYCLGLNKRSMAGHTICEHSGALHGTSSMGGFIMSGGNIDGHRHDSCADSTYNDGHRHVSCVDGTYNHGHRHDNCADDNYNHGHRHDNCADGTYNHGHRHDNCAVSSNIDGAANGIGSNPNCCNGYSVVGLCNDSDVETEEFNWACYNMLLGLPLDTKHWLGWEPVDYEFSNPEYLTGDYVVAEGETQHFIVQSREEYLNSAKEIPTEHPIFGKVLPQVFGDYRGEDVVLYYCGGARFAAFNPKDLTTRVNPMEFLIRNGKAWAVRCGTRIYERCD